MEMPLAVQYSSPARYALLLEESFQDATPGMKVSESALQYSSAFMVSGELMATLSSLSTVQALWPHRIQCSQPLASPEAWPSAKPAGVLFAFNALHMARKPGKSLGNSLKPALSVADLRYVI